jgi:TRAP-type C4-dicarboxylate transport system permease small subunit
METFNCVVALVFCIGMVWYGYAIAESSWMLDEHSSTDFSFPMWIYYAALPTGGLLMTVRYAIRLYRYLFRFDPATMTVGHTAEPDLMAPAGGDAKSATTN